MSARRLRPDNGSLTNREPTPKIMNHPLIRIPPSPPPPGRPKKAPPHFDINTHKELDWTIQSERAGKELLSVWFSGYRFAGFTYDCNATPESEFDRLAICGEWNPDSDRYRKIRERFESAVNWSRILATAGSLLHPRLADVTARSIIDSSCATQELIDQRPRDDRPPELLFLNKPVESLRFYRKSGKDTPAIVSVPDPTGTPAVVSTPDPTPVIVSAPDPIPAMVSAPSTAPAAVDPKPKVVQPIKPQGPRMKQLPAGGKKKDIRRSEASSWWRRGDDPTGVA